MSADAGQSKGSLFWHDAYWLRRLAYLGARYGSTGFMKHGSVAIGAFFWEFFRDTAASFETICA